MQEKISELAAAGMLPEGIPFQLKRFAKEKRKKRDTASQRLWAKIAYDLARSNVNAPSRQLLLKCIRKQSQRYRKPYDPVRDAILSQ